ncbi:MAG: DUF2961 domain-containing protein [Candidatus Hydrogenedens sp.]|nr:DUF2961 domain-containing protein [Candidatus Hydrogenedens sp.]
MLTRLTILLTTLCFLILSACHHGAPPVAESGNPLAGLSLLREGSSQRASSCDPDWEGSNADARYIPPGDCLVIADLKGPGIIQHFWNTVAASDRGYSRLLLLRMYWDDEEAPSVEVPLGDFFALGHGVDQTVDSIPVSVSSGGRARNCYWPMPFRKSARITVTNEGRGPVQAFYYYVDWLQVKKLPRDTAYFHASYRQEHPALSGKRYLIADIKGRGHYVGTVLNVRQHLPNWWGEGDDFWFIDGEATPRLRGTGTEDYFCDAWGLREFSAPWFGAPLMEGFGPLDRTTCYRWHVPDPVLFNKSLRLEIEHMGVTYNEEGDIRSGFEERADDFSSVAFWYQTEPHKVYEPLPPGEERLYGGWDKLVEAETLIENCTASQGNLEIQSDVGYGGGQIFWTPLEKNCVLEMEVEITEADAKELVLFLTRSHDYGIFQVFLDDRALGAAVDLFSQGLNIREYRFPLSGPAPGKHLLRFENKGKARDSGGYFFGLDAFMIF